MVITLDQRKLTQFLLTLLFTSIGFLFLSTNAFAANTFCNGGAGRCADSNGLSVDGQFKCTGYLTTGNFSSIDTHTSQCGEKGYYCFSCPEATTVAKGEDRDASLVDGRSGGCASSDRFRYRGGVAVATCYGAQDKSSSIKVKCSELNPNDAYCKKYPNAVTEYHSKCVGDLENPYYYADCREVPGAKPHTRDGASCSLYLSKESIRPGEKVTASLNLSRIPVEKERIVIDWGYADDKGKRVTTVSEIYASKNFTVESPAINVIEGNYTITASLDIGDASITANNTTLCINNLSERQKTLKVQRFNPDVEKTSMVQVTDLYGYDDKKTAEQNARDAIASGAWDNSKCSASEVNNTSENCKSYEVNAQVDEGQSLQFTNGTESPLSKIAWKLKKNANSKNAICVRFVSSKDKPSEPRWHVVCTSTEPTSTQNSPVSLTVEGSSHTSGQPITVKWDKFPVNTTGDSWLALYKEGETDTNTLGQTPRGWVDLRGSSCGNQNPPAESGSCRFEQTNVDTGTYHFRIFAPGNRKVGFSAPFTITRPGQAASAQGGQTTSGGQQSGLPSWLVIPNIGGGGGGGSAPAPSGQSFHYACSASQPYWCTDRCQATTCEPPPSSGGSTPSGGSSGGSSGGGSTGGSTGGSSGGATGGGAGGAAPAASTAPASSGPGGLAPGAGGSQEPGGIAPGTGGSGSQPGGLAPGTSSGGGSDSGPGGLAPGQ